MLSSNRMKVVQAPQVSRPRLRRNLLFLGAAALILFLDQATKELVRATLERGEKLTADVEKQVEEAVREFNLAFKSEKG